MNKGGTVQNIRISMMHADHSSELIQTNPQTGKKDINVGGEPASFIIDLKNEFRSLTWATRPYSTT